MKIIRWMFIPVYDHTIPSDYLTPDEEKKRAKAQRKAEKRGTLPKTVPTYFTPGGFTPWQKCGEMPTIIPVWNHQLAQMRSPKRLSLET